MYFHLQRLVLGDALNKNEEESVSTKGDEESEENSDILTDSNEDVDEEEDENGTSSETEDTLDKYGEPREPFLFEEDNTPNAIENEKDNAMVADFTDSDVEKEANGGIVEMATMNGNENGIAKRKKHRKRSQHKLEEKKVGNKKRKKKKNKKKQGGIWKTIVLANSPVEQQAMLFEEGPNEIAPSPKGSIVIDMTRNEQSKPKSPRFNLFDKEGK